MSNNINNINTNTMRSLVEAANGIDGISEAAVRGGDPMVEFDRLLEDFKDNCDLAMNRAAKVKKAYAEGTGDDLLRYMKWMYGYGDLISGNFADFRKIPLIDGFKKKHGKNR